MTAWLSQSRSLAYKKTTRLRNGFKQRKCLQSVNNSWLHLSSLSRWPMHFYSFSFGQLTKTVSSLQSNCTPRKIIRSARNLKSQNSRRSENTSTELSMMLCSLSLANRSSSIWRRTVSPRFPQSTCSCLSVWEPCLKLWPNTSYGMTLLFSASLSSSEMTLPKPLNWSGSKRSNSSHLCIHLASMRWLKLLRCFQE